MTFEPLFLLRQLYLVAAAVVVLPAAALAEVVEVELASGRVFEAQVDARTNADQLWLRFEEGRSYMLRGIDWDAVVEVRQGEQVLEPAAVSALATEFDPAAVEDSPRSSFQVVEHFPGVTGTQKSSPQVRWLSTDATYGKWTPNVGVDGLRVEVAPRDYTGEVVPVNGTLEVELYAYRQRGIQRVRHPQRLGRWSIQLSPEDFGPYGAVVPLKFQAFNPLRDQTIEPEGLVHTRLSVPGQGTFEASATDVELRPYSSFRDRLDTDTGRRYLPAERMPSGVR